MYLRIESSFRLVTENSGQNNINNTDFRIEKKSHMKTKPNEFLRQCTFYWPLGQTTKTN